MLVELGTIEAYHAIAPFLLRDVKSVVRRLQQRFLILHAWMWRACHSAAHCPAKFAARVCKSMGLHLLPQAFRERHCRVEDSPRKDQQEFLSTVPPDPVDLSRFRF